MESRRQYIGIYNLNGCITGYEAIIFGRTFVLQRYAVSVQLRCASISALEYNLPEVPSIVPDWREI